MLFLIALLTHITLSASKLYIRECSLNEFIMHFILKNKYSGFSAVLSRINPNNFHDTE